MTAGETERGTALGCLAIGNASLGWLAWNEPHGIGWIALALAFASLWWSALALYGTSIGAEA